MSLLLYFLLVVATLAVIAMICVWVLVRGRRREPISAEDPRVQGFSVLADGKGEAKVAQPAPPVITFTSRSEEKPKN
jgi:hypothetical protein